MSRHKKVKQFKSFADSAYTGYIGYQDEFDCESCGEVLYYPQKKCPDCKTTYTYSYAVLKLVRPDVVKRVEIPRTIHPWYNPKSEPISEVKSPTFKEWLDSGWRKWRNK